MSTATPAPAPAAAPSTANVTNPAPKDNKAGGNVTPPAPEPPRLMKLKLDGKEVELPESEVIAFAQQGKSASQKFQEAAKLRQEAEQILKFAKDNPKEFFQKTGMNAREWAEKYLMEELQVESMSPEQKKARENEEKLRKFEDAEKQRTEKARQEELQKMTNLERERLDKLFTQALNESGLPKTRFTVKRMAELQLINIKNKYELKPADLAKLVREDYANEQKALLTSLDGDQLIDFLGPENAKKFSKAQIAKLKARDIKPVAVQTKTEGGDGAHGLSWRDYQKRNRRRP